MIQRSDEWFLARCGKITASRISDIMPNSKGGYYASRKNYIAQLVCERLTGSVEESFSNKAMQWGTDKEPEARAAYEVLTGDLVREVGFIDHPDIAMSGASPDGLVGENGLIEIKCPNTATHLQTLITGKIDKKYIYQMLWQMLCTKRSWCDFVSYDPRLSDDYSFFLKKIRLSEYEDLTKEIEKQAKSTNEEIVTMIKKLEALKK